jgi:hypothetical protein
MQYTASNCAGLGASVGADVLDVDKRKKRFSRVKVS